MSITKWDLMTQTPEHQVKQVTHQHLSAALGTDAALGFQNLPDGREQS